MCGLVGIDQYLMKQVLSPENAAAAAPHYLNLLAIFIQYSLLSRYEDDKELVAFYEQYVVPESKLYLSRMRIGADTLIQYNDFQDLRNQSQ